LKCLAFVVFASAITLNASAGEFVLGKSGPPPSSTSSQEIPLPDPDRLRCMEIALDQMHLDQSLVCDGISAQLSECILNGMRIDNAQLLDNCDEMD
jgi:hypothetical protein